MTRYILVAALTLAVAFAGCKKGGDNGEAAPEAADKVEKKEEKGGVYAGHDPAADKKALQGTWSVKWQFGQPRATWTIAGDKLTWKDEKETVETKIEFLAPAQIGVKKGEATYQFDYAVTADGLYIGLGGAGRKIGDMWCVTERQGAISYDGEACLWYGKNLGSVRKPWDDPKPAKCAFVEKAGEKLFEYQTPKFMKEGEFEDHTLFVKGGWLLGEQLIQDHKVEKVQ